MSNYIPFFLIPFIAWGVRRFLKRKDDYTPLKKRTLVLGILAFSVTELVRSFYRPYIYANDIDDWVIADTIGNSTGTVTAIFMVLTLSGSGTMKDMRLILILTLGLLVYELMSVASGVDINDIWATLIFSLLSTGIYFFWLKRYGYPRAIE